MHTNILEKNISNSTHLKMFVWTEYKHVYILFLNKQHKYLEVPSINKWFCKITMI